MSVLDEAGLVHQAADVTARTSLNKKKRDRGEIVATTKDMSATAKGTAAKKFFLDSFIFLVLPKNFQLPEEAGY
mgnify:CR=1 FL=1